LSDSSAAVGGFEGDAAAVELRRFSHEREAEAGAFAAHGVVAEGVKSLENTLFCIFRNPRAMIAEGEFHLSRAGLEANLDR